jgi:hypothetical protein
MAKTQTVNKNAGQIEPGESNARAVRDGIRTRLGSTGSSKNAVPEEVDTTNVDTEESNLAQPVNRGEDIEADDVDVRTARRRPAGAVKSAKRATTRAAKRPATTRRR